MRRLGIGIGIGFGFENLWVWNENEWSGANGGGGEFEGWSCFVNMECFEGVFGREGMFLKWSFFGGVQLS